MSPNDHHHHQEGGGIVAWREYDIHSTKSSGAEDNTTTNNYSNEVVLARRGRDDAKEDSEQQEDAEEEAYYSGGAMFLFQTDGGDDLKEFEFPLLLPSSCCSSSSSSTSSASSSSSSGEDDHHHVHYYGGDDSKQITRRKRILRVTCQDDYTQSTGIAIWRGSEVLAQYLQESAAAAPRRRQQDHDHAEVEIQGKTVLELGAGVGVVGLVAHHLGAKRVLWTDGDERVLKNLRNNVERNLLQAKTSTQGEEQDDPKGTTFALAQSFCPQLIWGHGLEAFRKKYGRSQVILGTDLFYMTKSLDPLFHTVDQLLVSSLAPVGTDGDDDADADHDDIGGSGIFVAVNSCASQSPMSTVLEVASKYGFTWTTTTLRTSKMKNYEDVSTPDEEEVAPQGDKDDELIYLFTRKSRMHS